MWGGVLMVAGYATGTLYERNQKTLREMQDGCGEVLASLQNFLANQKYSEARLPLVDVRYADRRRGCPGRGRHRRHSQGGFAFQYEGSGHDQRSALQSGAGIARKHALADSESRKAKSKDAALIGSLQRAIPIFLSEHRLRQIGGKPEDASLEVHILVLAEEYGALISGQSGAKMSPSRAGQGVIKRAGNHYDSLVLDGFTKIFGGPVAGASA
jgi:hypothetical protein